MANGMVCYHHQSKPAVAQCAECGKGICKDCYDMYGDSKTALCFNCTENSVKEHASDIMAFREQVKRNRTKMIAGGVIGGIFLVILGIISAVGTMSDMGGGFVGVLAFIVAVLIMLVLGVLVGFGFGGSAGTIFGFIWRFPIDGFMKFIILFMSLPLTMGVLAVVGPIITLVRFFKQKKQMAQADEIIADDERILQEMRDYFAYTQAMERSTGVDLAKLADQGGELFNNTYAKSVIKDGEKAAQARLRQGAVQIAANGEIIRTFSKPKNKEEKAA
jgi:hypothetical protein